MRQIGRRTLVSALLAITMARSALSQDTTVVRDTAVANPMPGHSPDSTVAEVAEREHHFWLPMYEILGFLTINNLIARTIYPNATEDGIKVYDVTFKSTWNHITVQRWVFDIDPFNTNQFQHPIQGATMYGFARSSGHGFWPSLVYSNVGSFIWKMAGETDPPSINDIITTGQAGSMLGEAMYRMADLIIRDSGSTGPSVIRQITSGVLSGGVNRRILGKHFANHLPDSLPAFFWQLNLGGALGALSHDITAPANLRQDAVLDFGIAYGLPGRIGYTYTRPFDYFDFEASVLPSEFSDFIQNIMVRGLLAGEKTKDADNSRGIWGLYATFDYISPQQFRVSSTALSLGTTREYRLAPALSLQGSVLSGVGFGAAGSTTIIPSTPTAAAIRDYHFGLTPQAMLNLRLIAADRAMIDMTSRYYYVSGAGSDDSRGIERIFRGDLGVTFRIYKSNALGLKYTYSTRDATYGTLAPITAHEGSYSIFYTVLGSRHFGSVAW